MAASAAAVVLAAALGAAGPAAAQEPAPREPAAAPEWRPVGPRGSDGGGLRVQAIPAEAPQRARLGLFVRMTCEEEATGECGTAPVVVSVVPGGPADRAGVRAGDELVSLDGVSLASAEGRDALSSLEAGAGVRLVVRGSSGTRELRVTPELRDAAAVIHLERQLARGGAENAGVRVFRLPSAEGMERLELRLDSLRGSARTSFVLVGPDARGSLQVEVAGEEVARVFSRAEGAAPSAPVGYLVESPELAGRLERAREASLRNARVRLDSLVRLRREIDGAVVFVPEPGEWNGAPQIAGVQRAGRVTWTLRAAAPELEPLLTANQRLAGAEFRSLTPELAEYFRGVGSGLLVLRVIGGTPADRLGLRGGDVVFEAAGRPVDSVEALRAAIEAADGGAVPVKWVRKGIVFEGRFSAP